METPGAAFDHYDGYLRSKLRGPGAKEVPDLSDDDNHSGEGKGAPVPAEIKGWNWGATFLSWIWAIKHRTWIGLLALVPFPLLGLGISIYLGAKGNELAWRNKRWESVQAFQNTQRRWRTAGIIVLVVAFVVWMAIVVASVVTSPEIAGDPDESRTLTSTDGRVTLSVPGNWTEEIALNDDATLQAGNRLEELYVIAISEPKADFPPDVNLDRYAQVTRDNLLASITGGRVTSGPQDVPISGMRALRTELAGSVDGQNVVYVVAAVETPTHYVQLMAWTLADRFEENRATLIRTIETFKVVAPA